MLNSVSRFVRGVWIAVVMVSSIEQLYRKANWYGFKVRGRTDDVVHDELLVALYGNWNKCNWVVVVSRREVTSLVVGGWWLLSGTLGQQPVAERC